MRKLLLLVLIVTALIQSNHAQKISIENVRKSALRTSDVIKEGTEVKGYYFFYINDKVDKNTNEYILSIYDNNLKLLKEIKFQDSKYVTVLESSFNGTDLIFLFYNSKDKTFEYQIYGADGNKKEFTYNRQLSTKEKNYLNATFYSMQDEEKTYKGLYPVEGKGFVSNMPSREGNDYTFQIQFFSSQNKKEWSYIPTEDSKRATGDYLGCYNGVVYVEVLKFTGVFDQKPDSYILGLDLETGKQLFEKSTDSKYRFFPISMSQLEDGRNIIYGEFFDENGNIMKDKSLGFAFWSIDDKGKVLSEKYSAWDLELGKFLNVTGKGKIDDFGYMFLHNMVQASNGSIYAIGEGYKKVASALGIAANLLTSNANISVTKIKVTDMILIEFDKDFKVKSAKIYEKNSNSYELPSGYAWVSTQMIGKIIKYNYGGFDYSYTTVNKDGSSFTVCYSDFVREGDYRGGTFNSISYNEGKFTKDRINTRSEASRTRILPGKLGQVLITEYYRKDKRLEAHFEKLN